MKKREYPAIGMCQYQGKLPSGLQILVVPMPGFTKKVAYLVTDYGAIHTDFIINGEKQSSPAGVAHYLEHKLFDMPERDITAEFAALGAVPNAFTAYDMTAYHFSCTEHFEENLSLLLEFVTTPYFTPESVEKEQGIIGQEIGMNLDNPDTRVFENLMEAMYGTHPIREPILGSVESIAKITPQVLEDCHASFYRPDNMLLCVIGDVDPGQVYTIAETRFPLKDRLPVEKQTLWAEEMRPIRQDVSETMEVSMPMFQLGFKCEPTGEGTEAIRQEMIGDLAAEWLFGESSELYLQLYEQGLIDGSFGGGFETVSGMAMLSCGGDSRDPAAVRDAIIEKAQKLIREGLGEAELQRMKRSALGRRLRELDSFDTTAFRICAYYFSGYDYFEFPKLYQKIDPSDLTAFLERTVTRQRVALSVIYPCSTTKEEKHVSHEYTD